MQIQLALVSDRNMIPGAHATLASALYRIPREESPSIHLFHRGWAASDVQSIKRTVADAHQSATLEVHECDDTTCGKFRAALGSNVNYMLFTIPAILEGRVLCLDVDLVVRADLSELFRIDLSPCIAAAVAWEDLSQSADKFLFVQQAIDLRKPHFNTGVILADCDAWRCEGISEKAMTLRAKWDSRILGGDQPVLNAVLVDRILSLPRRFNTMISPHRPPLTPGQLNEQRVWHFVGRPKPWDFLGKWFHSNSAMFFEELARAERAGYRRERQPLLRGMQTLLRYSKRYLQCLKAKASRTRIA